MYIKRCQNACQQHGTLVARIFMGGFFLLAGFNKLSGGVAGPEGFESMVAGIGIPAPLLVAWLVVLIEIIGGAALILGYKFRDAAGVLFVFTLITTLLVHLDMNDPMLMKNAAIMGGLLYMMAYGPGNGWKMEKEENGPFPSM